VGNFTTPENLLVPNRHGHTAWTGTCSMDKTYRMDRDIQHRNVHVAWTCTCTIDMNMLHWHAVQTCKTDMQHGHAARTCSTDMVMQCQYGHVAKRRTCYMNMPHRHYMQQGHAVRTCSQTCGTNMQHGQAAWTRSTWIRIRHAAETSSTHRHAAWKLGRHGYAS
jgi:hypothetical protein